MEPVLDNFFCLGLGGFHRVAVAYWPGAASAGTSSRVTICVHGLTRNGRDFDDLAHALVQRGDVWAPDMPGRGRSSWLAAAADYSYPLYMADIAALIARTRADEVDFVGTSMGGIIGMLLAASSPCPIRRLVLNDVGPLIPRAALERIGQYVGRAVSFADLDEAASFLSRLHAPFGNLSDAQWHHMAVHGTRKLDDGRLTLGYDPAIAQAFQGTLADVDLWAYYDRMTCPTLLVRGARSDLLPAETAAEMTRRGPCAQLYEVPDAGHAPALSTPEQIAAIMAFLEA